MVALAMILVNLLVEVLGLGRATATGRSLDFEILHLHFDLQ